MSTRRLTLIRHAKASNERKSGQDDHDRPLASRGEADVEAMGRRLADDGFLPDRIVASTARRAEQTADAIATAIGFPLERIDRTIDVYLAGRSQLQAIVEETDRAVDHLALVGHNPGMSLLWGWLTDDDHAELPTCGVARLELPIDDWREVFEGCARLLEFARPDR